VKSSGGEMVAERPRWMTSLDAVPAASRKVRRELYEGYHAFIAAYREAAEKLRAGDRTVIFPAGRPQQTQMS